MGSCNFKNPKDVKSIQVVQIPIQDTIRDSRRLTISKGPDQIDVRNPSLFKTQALDTQELKPEQGSVLLTKALIKIEGLHSEEAQSAFQDKLTHIKGESDQSEFLLKMHMWVCCKKGLKPDHPNQDDFTILFDGNDYLLCVFDGHGIYGHHISNFVHLEIPNLLLAHPQWSTDPSQSLKDSFIKCHQNLIKSSCTQNSNFDCNMSGCTSTVIYKKGDILYVAHVGDSRAIIGRRTETGYVPVGLTKDHKPELQGEKLRIEASGGEVRKLPGNNPYRVYMKNKEYPGISMSRALGDLVSQSIGVICVPEISVVNLIETDEFIILCSDGVWEFISDEEAVDIVKSSNHDPKEAASRLAALAWTKWISNEGNVVDDITVIIAYLPISNFE